MYDIKNISDMNYASVRDDIRLHLSNGIDLLFQLTIRQPITVFILLLIIDFACNTFMLYYDYVYIMVDVDFGVQNMNRMYVWHEQQQQQQQHYNNNDVIHNHPNRKKIDAQSISFIQQSTIYSYQQSINLIIYIMIYVSQLNGFFAYVWCNDFWLTLHLILLTIQIIFLLFLSIVNIRMIIVLLFRMMLFFMSLFRSLSISNQQMIHLQHQESEIIRQLQQTNNRQTTTTTTKLPIINRVRSMNFVVDDSNHLPTLLPFKMNQS